MSSRSNWRNSVAFAYDAAAAAVAWVVAYLLRFNFDLPAPYGQAMTINLLWVVPVQAAVFSRARMYRGLWRYASLIDLRRIVLSALTGAMAIVLVVYIARRPDVPRSVIVMYPLLLTALMAGSRLAYRSWKEGHFARLDSSETKRVIILGAGRAAANLLSAVSRSPEWRFVGLLDDDASKRGREIYGVKVVGRLDELSTLAEALDIDQAIVAMPGQPHGVRRRAVELCNQAGIATLTVPSYEDIVSGRVRASSLRKVELEDLLGRDPIQLDSDGLSRFLGMKCVLVTGAGGSIGSELCRQIIRHRPAMLVLFELNEYALYQIHDELSALGGAGQLIPVAGDVKDASRLEQVFTSFKPDVVFHAAAYKHVPLMEQLNAWQAVRNNALGTLATLRAADRSGAKAFVLVSTDKAVNPTNVMGATKRLAELICLGYRRGSTIKIVTVRFGNVLGSTGSVVPKFRHQIAQGGPITVTDREMTRFFMSISEAAQLVLQAGMMGRGGEIFVLDMGEPVKIVDLARDMIRLSGLSEEEIKIVFTGLRPGEKLYEEVLADHEQTLPTPHPKLRVARATQMPDERSLDQIVEWVGQDRQVDDQAVRQDLGRWVPEYRSSESPLQDRGGTPPVLAEVISLPKRQGA